MLVTVPLKREPTGIFGGDALPRIGLELLDAEADALGLGIDADDLHLHRVADIHDLARMGDASPCHVGDMQQPVDAAEIDEGAVVGDVLDHAVDDLALFETGDDLAALLGAGLFQHRAAGDDDIAAAAIHLQDLEGLRLVHQRADVADRANVHLAARQERHGAVEIDGEAALDAVEDHAFDALARLVFLLEPGPALLAPRLLARQHGLAGRILDALEIDIDLVADREIVRAARQAELFQGDAAFGLEPDVDYRNVLLDRDDGALDHTAFLERSPGEGFLKQGGELVAARMAYARLRLGHLGSYSASHHHTLSCLRGFAGGRLFGSASGAAGIAKAGRGRPLSYRPPPLANPRGKSSKSDAPMQNGHEPQPACPARPIAASIKSMAALNAASIAKFVVSSKYASAAWRNGAAARFLSRSSRRLISARHFRLADAVPAAPQLEKAPPGALLGGGGDEQLHVGFGANDGADIAAIEHRAGLAPGESALIGKQRLPHRRVAGDDGGRLAEPAIHQNADRPTSRDRAPWPRPARRLASAGLAPAARVSRATAR